MHVVMITGSKPAEICGVGDYTACLVNHLNAAGVTTTIFYSDDWRWGNIGKIRREILSLNPDIVHMQFPTLGYGMQRPALFLSAIVRGVPVTITLHEFKTSLPIRKHFSTVLKIWNRFLVLAIFADRFVFNDETELRAFQYCFPWRKNHVAEIPIGATISAAGETQRTPGSVAFFGQLIRPEMLDKFFSLCELDRRSQNRLDFSIIGGYPPEYKSIAEVYKKKALMMNVKTSINLEKNEVSKCLAGTCYAYLPFSEGAHAKRTSILASLLNKTIILAPHDDNTPDWLKRITVDAPTPEVALEKIYHFEENSEERENLRRSIAANWARFDWQEIAKAHSQLYNAVLSA